MDPKRRRRWIARLIFWPLFILGLVAFRYFFIFPSAGSGPAGPPVPAEPFGHVWDGRRVVLLGIGDSITQGFGASQGFSYFQRLLANPPGDSPDMMGKNLSVVFPHLEPRNMSAAGTTSLDHERVLIPSITTYPPDVLGVVVMTSGGNDLIHDYGQSPPREGAMYGATLAQAQPWIDRYETRLNTMVESIRAAFPGGCHIFLANIYDPSDGTGSTGLTGLPAWDDALPILSAYNRIIARCAETHDFVHLVDIHGPFLGHGIHCTKFWTPHYRRKDPHNWYSIIEDPNDRGYDAVRRLFLLAMIDVFAAPTERTNEPDSIP
jgi:lysophospholipase L1-like esterase